jgi:hypothetical protein
MEDKLIDRVCEMIGRACGDAPLFPATVFYNEGWMVRLILDTFDRMPVAGHGLTPAEGARWFSEALLPSAFLPTSRKDPLGESWTHADGIVGHFVVGRSGRADLTLAEAATQLVVIEAKMFSRLSSGVSHARYYDQAARNVACMAEVLHRAGRDASSMKQLGFFVVAPQSQIDDGVFGDLVSHRSVRKKVERRVSEYGGAKDDWFYGWFEPLLSRIELDCLSWENLIQEIGRADEKTAELLDTFYTDCIRFNELARSPSET